jgi:hypothetical protein
MENTLSAFVSILYVQKHASAQKIADFSEYTLSLFIFSVALSFGVQGHLEWIVER